MHISKCVHVLMVLVCTVCVHALCKPSMTVTLFILPFWVNDWIISLSSVISTSLPSLFNRPVLFSWASPGAAFCSQKNIETKNLLMDNIRYSHTRLQCEADFAI